MYSQTVVCTPAVGSGVVTLGGFTPGVAFRLVPLDGAAAFPRTVMVGGVARVVADSGWKFSNGATNAQIVPLNVQALIASAFSAAAVQEVWSVEVAEDRCECVPQPPVSGGEQILYDSGDVAWPVYSGTPTKIGVFDLRAFSEVLIEASAITTSVTAALHLIWAANPLAMALDVSSGVQPKENLTIPAGVSNVRSGVVVIMSRGFGVAGSSPIFTETWNMPLAGWLYVGVNTGGSGSAITGSVRIVARRWP